MLNPTRNGRSRKRRGAIDLYIDIAIGFGALLVLTVICLVLLGSHLATLGLP